MKYFVLLLGSSKIRRFFWHVKHPDTPSETDGSKFLDPGKTHHRRFHWRKKRPDTPAVSDERTPQPSSSSLSSMGDNPQTPSTSEGISSIEHSEPDSTCQKFENSKRKFILRLPKFPRRRSRSIMRDSQATMAANISDNIIPESEMCEDKSQ